MVIMKAFIFACDLLVPVSMLVCGLLFLKRPPKKRNYYTAYGTKIKFTYGYRTRMSSINAETWAFAQKLCGKIWYRAGLIMLPLSVLAHLPVLGRGIGAFGTFASALVAVQCAVMVGSIIPVETALRRTFNNDGSRKTKEE